METTTNMRPGWRFLTSSPRTRVGYWEHAWDHLLITRGPQRPSVGIMPSDQRMLANPMLAIAGLALWWYTLRVVIAWREPITSALVASTLLLIPLLPRYHCLDCGHAGLYWGWRHHACERVLLRHDARHSLSAPVLSDLDVQMRLWLLAVGSALIVTWIMAQT